MQCPFCGAGMVRGELRNRGGNYFLPEGHREPWFYSEGSMKKAGAFMLPPSPLSFRPRFLTAHWCETCNKIIRDCEH